MDPIATLLDAILAETTSETVQHVHAFRNWKARGGYVPLVEEIRAEADRRGIDLPSGWVTTARAAGARG